jgi:hypothetical protein
MFESGAWIIILEALLALVMGILIVWFTIPRGVRAGDIHRPVQDGSAAAPEAPPEEPGSGRSADPRPGQPPG